MTKKRIIILSISIILILIIALIILFVIRGNKGKKEVNTISISELESNFNSIFTNTTHPENEEKVHLAYDVETSETGKYKINTNIPNINMQSAVATNINNDIFGLFVKKIADIMKQTTSYTIYNVDYVSYTNNNILSIVIKCTLKEGANPQRTIIKTYNYNTETDELLTLNKVINLKNLNSEEIQNKIFEKIKNEYNRVSIIENSGYNIYKRDINSNIYKIDNTTEFFLGEQNVLYVMYPYGNNNYTSEMDLIIFE